MEEFELHPEQICTKEEGLIRRYIFEEVALFPEEEDALKELRLARLPNERDKLRFLYACSWDLQNTKKAIEEYVNWATAFPADVKSLRTRVDKTILNSSAIYLHGVDIAYRPILILNFAAFNLSTFLIDDYIDVSVFLLEYAIRKVCVPGKVESWTVLCDMGGQWFEGVTVQDLEKVLLLFSSHYPCRLAQFFIYRPPKIIDKLQKIVEPFASQTLLNKIQIDVGGQPTSFLQSVSAGQVEQRYGGYADNRSEFWPPTFPASGQIQVPAINDGHNSFDGLSGIQGATESDVGVGSNDDSFYRSIEFDRPFHMSRIEQHQQALAANEDGLRQQQFLVANESQRQHRTVTPRVRTIPSFDAGTIPAGRFICTTCFEGGTNSSSSQSSCNLM